jgi:hypothetical protein
VHVNGLESLRSLFDVELHLIAFVETLIAVTNYCFIMDENIFAVTAGNETKTFGSIEPLDCSLFHGTNPFDVCCTDSFGAVYACFVCFIKPGSITAFFNTFTVPVTAGDTTFCRILSVQRHVHSLKHPLGEKKHYNGVLLIAF